MNATQDLRGPTGYRAMDDPAYQGSPEQLADLEKEKADALRIASRYKKYRMKCHDPVHNIYILQKKVLGIFWIGVSAGSKEAVKRTIEYGDLA